MTTTAAIARRRWRRARSAFDGMGVILVCVCSFLVCFIYLFSCDIVISWVVWRVVYINLHVYIYMFPVCIDVYSSVSCACLVWSGEYRHMYTMHHHSLVYVHGAVLRAVGRAVCLCHSPKSPIPAACAIYTHNTSVSASVRRDMHADRQKTCLHTKKTHTRKEDVSAQYVQDLGEG